MRTLPVAMLIASCWLATSARAQESASPSLLAALAPMPLAHLVGAWSRGGRAIGGSGAGGLLVGIDGAYATTVSVPERPAHGTFAFGGRVGWSFPNGLALHVRYDDLGVKPTTATSPLQFATAGCRYTVPFVVPMPFAEVDLGAAWYGGDPRFGAGAALGASLPLSHHILIDVVGHDWFVSIAGVLRQTLSVGLALAVTFGSPAG